MLLHRTILLAFMSSALGMVVGCGTTPPETEPPTTGTAVLRFSVPDNARMSAALVDPLVGPVYGEIYFAEDVGVTGPHSGVEKVASVEVAKVDVTKTDPSVETWTSGPLEPHDYTFLGMFDVDNNADPADRNPDPGDPVTVPGSSDFKVVVGDEVEGLVQFGLIYN